MLFSKMHFEEKILEKSMSTFCYKKITTENSKNMGHQKVDIDRLVTP